MSDQGELLKSAMHSRHVALDAKMTDEAGWSVPLSYAGVLDEAARTRRRASVFDLSHCGRFRIRGDEAPELLERACTADVAGLEDNSAAWTPLCNTSGGIVDRVRLIRLERFWVMVTSPVCRAKVFEHLSELACEFDAAVDDQTSMTSLLAVAGPDAARILDAVLPMDVGGMQPDDVAFGSFMVARYIADRCDLGRTWALMVQLPNMLAGQAWQFITARAGRNAIAPAGLGAWDVLRIEAGQCRYGHEMNETIDPLACGLGGEVDIVHDFLGRDALEAIGRRGPSRVLAGLILEDPCGESGQERLRVPQMGTPVCSADGGEIGAITSGTFSPALDRTVALAMLAAGSGEPDSPVTVAMGERTVAARTARLPFVDGRTA